MSALCGRPEACWHLWMLTVGKAVDETYQIHQVQLMLGRKGNLANVWPCTFINAMINTQNLIPSGTLDPFLRMCPHCAGGCGDRKIHKRNLGSKHLSFFFLQLPWLQGFPLVIHSSRRSMPFSEGGCPTSVSDCGHDQCLTHGNLCRAGNSTTSPTHLSTENK